MRVVSIRNLAINDADPEHGIAGNFSSWLEEAYSVPGYQPVAVELEGNFPLITALKRPVHTLNLHTQIMTQDVDDRVAYRNLLLAAVDPSKGAIPLIVADDDGEGSYIEGTERFVMAVARQPGQCQDRLGAYYVFTLDVSGDPFWWNVTETTAAWQVASDGAVTGITNPGTLDAEPLIRLEATDQRSAPSWKYRQPLALLWNSDRRGKQYPIMIEFDTATPIAADQILSDAKDHFGVLINGVEVWRWFPSAIADGDPGGWNSASTKIWINVDAEPRAYTFTINDLSALDTNPEKWVMGADISAFPDSGHLYVDNGEAVEILYYTSKDDIAKTFYGITRGVHGTSPITLEGGLLVYWLQHAVSLVWGDRTALFADDSYKPIIHLGDSDNETHVYYEFGDDDGRRAARWEPIEQAARISFSTGDFGTQSDPYETIGLIASSDTGIGQWQLTNPIGIIRYSAFGHQRNELVGPVTNRFAFIGFSTNGLTFDTGQAIDYPPYPAEDQVWENFTVPDTTLDKTYHYMAVANNRDPNRHIEIVTTTLILHADFAPTAYLIGEPLDNYDMQATLANTSTGEALEITVPNLLLGESLVIDTANWRIYSLDDRVNRFAQVARDTNRTSLLRLEPGVNTFRYDEDGVEGVNVSWSFHKRNYV